MNRAKGSTGIKGSPPIGYSVELLQIGESLSEVIERNLPKADRRMIMRPPSIA
jgi:hypothetical protein